LSQHANSDPALRKTPLVFQRFSRKKPHSHDFFLGCVYLYKYAFTS